VNRSFAVGNSGGQLRRRQLVSTGFAVLCRTCTCTWGTFGMLVVLLGSIAWNALALGTGRGQSNSATFTATFRVDLRLHYFLTFRHYPSIR